LTAASPFEHSASVVRTVRARVESRKFADIIYVFIRAHVIFFTHAFDVVADRHVMLQRLELTLCERCLTATEKKKDSPLCNA